MSRLVVSCLVLFAFDGFGQVEGTSANSSGQHGDTLQLHEHLVRGSLPRYDRGLAATGTTADSILLDTYERASLQGALAWVPGVQMDTRGLGGSARLSIRGSVLRAPFGVRGVKVYWGPFPITLADGTTPLELLDPSVIGDLEAVRSIGSPLYGSAPAGLLLTELPDLRTDGREVSLGYTRGSYEFDRLETELAWRRNGRFVSGGGVLQNNVGYREQESSNKQQAFLVGGRAGPRGSATGAITYQHAYWQLPGSLDSLTAAGTPTAANAWSRVIDAHVDKSQIFGGLNAEHRFGRIWLLRVTITGQRIDKKNPYGTNSAFTGVKEEHYSAAGLRLSATGRAWLSKWLIEWELGAEGLYEEDDLMDRSYDANLVATSVRTDALFTIGNATPYIVVQAQYRHRLWLFGGVGGELNDYVVDDRHTFHQDQGVGRQSAWPHAGLRLRVTRGVHVHLRYAEGVSRPTITELWTGSALNIGLFPEHVSEVEIAMHIASRDSTMRASVAGFHRSIGDRIVTGTDLSGRPSTGNAGDAVMQGVEMDGSVQLGIGHAAWFVARGFFSVQALSAVDHDRHIDGERLAGVPLLTGGINLQLHGWRGWNATLSSRYTGDVLAHDGGDEALPGAVLCAARIGHEFHIARRGAVELFMLCENLLDEQYSGWVQLNDPGGRYYNPAPGRSYFGGVRVRLR
ncbi:MAG: TonB-dependent receptor [Flavobacteriales bacterium]